MGNTNDTSKPMVVVATDGSCLRNPGGPSAWAWYVSEDNWAAGGFVSGTNQQAELTAVLAALRGIPLDMPLQIETDSDYTMKACTKWIASWKKRGWKKSDGSSVANLDLMIDLDIAMTSRKAPFSIIWVKGHAGHAGNETADRIAGETARQVQRKKAVNSGPGWTGIKAPVTSVKSSEGKAGFALPATDTSTRRMPVKPKRLLDEAVLPGFEDDVKKPAPLMSDGKEAVVRTKLKSSLPHCETCGTVINLFTGMCENNHPKKA